MSEIISYLCCRNKCAQARFTILYIMTNGNSEAGKKPIMVESILDLNANNVWDLSDYQIGELWERDRKEEDFSTSEDKLLNIIRLAFEVVHYNVDDPRDVKKYESGGWVKICHCNPARGVVAIRRKSITRISDLSYENIRHISAPELLSLLEANFGSGWESLSLQIRDVIETGFDISTTQLPTSRIHTPGGTLSKKVAQGYDVLEIPRGTWTEAIFAKKKDPVAKIRFVVPEARFDEDGNPLPDDEALSDGNADDQDDQNDDTFYSSYAAEANAKAEDEEAEAEGMEIE